MRNGTSAVGYLCCCDPPATSNELFQFKNKLAQKIDIEVL